MRDTIGQIHCTSQSMCNNNSTDAVTKGDLIRASAITENFFLPENVISVVFNDIVNSKYSFERGASERDHTIVLNAPQNGMQS